MTTKYYSCTRNILISNPTLLDYVKRFEIAKLAGQTSEESFYIVDHLGKEHLYSTEFAIQDTGDELAYMLHTNSAIFQLAFTIVYSNLLDGIKPHVK